MTKPLVISHRTQMGSMPENTLAGIDAAVASGADAVEIDVRATADGELVLMHDGTLERTVGDAREPGSVTLEEFRTLEVLDPFESAGRQPIPTFDETLACVAGRGLLVIELKEAGLEERVAAAVRAHNAADWSWIWCFQPAVVQASRAAMPEVPAWLTFSSRSAAYLGDVDPFEFAPRVGAAGISVAYRDVTPELVERARRRGLLVSTWTVNEPDDLTRVRDAGVDAICGDFPDRTLAAIGR
jgi:glycerophosphoryl diester phosphodiesterase